MEKILIANRGEIAIRIISTARDMGYRTVAVYSEADTDSPHVACADEAVLIGAAPVGESYLNADKIIAAARKTGADAIHPGYGFLSENADFARRCAVEGISFIGPSAAAIELMGSKRLSKLAMLKAGVPCISGYQDKDQSDEALMAGAKDIGFPIMVKASAGGGGRGMRLVENEAVLAENIKTARSEAENAFGSGELILEKAVLEPRHIEIQVFGDNHGNVVHLFERDCSVQRRHQKVVEEAPSPFVDKTLRAQMGKAAVDAAISCDYSGAGTVEFLVDKDQNFYFLEMNTRLQVEHPVTELVTGLDLVEWQLRIAEGEPLPLTQEDITLDGHAIEVRLYAEDPRENYMPQTGRIQMWEPDYATSVRVDDGIISGQNISAHYDPMLAKLIVWSNDRNTAVRKLARGLDDSCLLGLGNNKALLSAILRHPDFKAGNATTAFLSDHFTDHPTTLSAPPTTATVAKAALVLFRNEQISQQYWSVPDIQKSHINLVCGNNAFQLKIHSSMKGVTIELGDEKVIFSTDEIGAFECRVTENNVQSSFFASANGNHVFIDDGNGHFHFKDVTHLPASAGKSASSGELKAPMDSLVVGLNVTEGDTVTAGNSLVTVEAMKMEHTLKAPFDGTVSQIAVAEGDQVKSKTTLIVVVPFKGEK